MEECASKKSGWSLHQIQRLQLRVNKFNPLRGSSYLSLPENIAKTNSVVNPINKFDEQCFKWAFLAFFVLQNPERIKNLFKYEIRYHWDCIKFPTPISDIKKFEAKNNVSINVFALNEKNEVYPIKVCDLELKTHRDLLIIQEKETTHYCLIKNFNTLVHPQITLNNNPIFVCKRCFSHYYQEKKLTEHLENCKTHKAVRIKMPQLLQPGNLPPVLKFKNHQRQLPVPFVIYADFEAALVKIEGAPYDPSVSSTRKYQEHQAISFGATTVSTLPKDKVGDVSLSYKDYQGTDAASKFMEHVSEQAQEIEKVYKRKTPLIPMTKDEISKHNSKRECYLCDEEFTHSNYRIREHCHLTGKYRGAAHTNCNLKYKDPGFIPVFLHNLSGYDAHFIVRELGFKKGRIHVIPNTQEKYIAFSKQVGNITLKFIDTFRFMSSSLEQLAKTLSPDDFLNLAKEFEDPILFDLVCRKGVFCYDYLDSIDVLKIKHLPSKEHFYNKLYETEISDLDYDHAVTVWKAFDCKTLLDYCRLYQKVDVLLLADIFENFRKICMKTYNLDPAWYYTAPGLAWDAALFLTKIHLELLTDIDMLLMIEKGIRGGVAQCCKRYCKAKKCGDCINNIHILYADANNLYAVAMSMLLPNGGFKWVPVDSFPHIMSINAQGPIGYFLEVDVEYPVELHEKHNNLPYLPQTLVPPGGKHAKLLTTLFHKHNYVIHIVNLQQAIAAGLKVTKIHNILKFNQSDWLKAYIDLNTKMRQNALSAFEKDFFKLMNNAVFGKTMENLRMRLNIELVTDIVRLRKVIAKPNFLDRTIYNETLVGCQLGIEEVLMNKPIYVGAAILDLSKTVMYDFYYNKLLPIYGDRMELLYMDTDSYVIEIRTANLYQDIKDNAKLFDTSNYPVNHMCFSNVNKKVPGTFKDEAAGKVITEFVGLRAKMYALKIDGFEMKRAKGVKNYALQAKISFDDYHTCLLEHKEKLIMSRQIQSKDHILNSVEQIKISLSPFDDKRHILEDGIHTLAHGNVKIVEM